MKRNHYGRVRRKQLQNSRGCVLGMKEESGKGWLELTGTYRPGQELCASSEVDYRKPLEGFEQEMT